MDGDEIGLRHAGLVRVLTAVQPGALGDDWSAHSAPVDTRLGTHGPVRKGAARDVAGRHVTTDRAPRF
ncbi:hypothetical protein GCM10010193_06520 [Kitasatospora atroaurantiaca]|uniref:Uncharacterized protein n=1 Tax=Kitasatospora atroaurantiaca TaxID=285545 RepID=A0A561EJ37_9ACTN|nr:hypothetical protein FB465_0542 [Kitasatospora atroaurantiaca]